MTTEIFLPRSFLPTGIIFPIEEVYLYLWHDHIKSTDNSKVVMLNELSIRPKVQLLSSLNSSNNRLHYTKALNFEYIQCSIDFKIFFDLHGNFDEDRFYIKVLIAFSQRLPESFELKHISALKETIILMFSWHLSIPVRVHKTLDWETNIH